MAQARTTTRCKRSSAIASRTDCRPCSPTRGRIPSTTSPPTLYYANVPPGASSDRGSSTYDIRHTFSGAVSYDIPAPGAGIWKSIFGNWSTDSIIYARTAPPVNVVTGQNTFGLFLSGATSVQRPNLVPGVPLWISDPNVAGGKRINKAAFTVPTGPVQGNSRPQRPQRIRRDRGRSDPAPPVQALRAPLAPGPRRLLQHLQPPELRPADQLHDLSPLRPGDPDARSLARRRRPDRRPQSALPDRRPALGATGAEAHILKQGKSEVREVARLRLSLSTALTPRHDSRIARQLVRYRRSLPPRAKSGLRIRARENHVSLRDARNSRIRVACRFPCGLVGRQNCRSSPLR